MELTERINQDLLAATRAGQASTVGVLRLIKSALANEKIKLRHELAEAEVLAVVRREAKQRGDSIAAYQAAGRQDLVDQESAELAVIESYLPQAMDDEALGKLVDEVRAELGAEAQMGQVIGEVLKRAQGAADGGRVSSLVRQRLGR